MPGAREYLDCEAVVTLFTSNSISLALEINRGEILYNYTAYGLAIESEVALPELLPATRSGRDLIIRTGKVDRLPPESTQADKGFRYHLSPQEAYFCWDATAAFLVRSGREIIIDPAPGAEEAMIRVLLLGVLMAILLHQRGLLVLHASAVDIDGGAVVFLGGKGWGKSTMAATLYTRGHLHLADDLVAIETTEMTSARVLSGYPQLKLWPDAVAPSLEEDPELLPRVAPGFEKRACRTADRFSRGAVPLRAVYALSDGEAPELRVLKPQEAIVQLIGNSYIARFGNHLLNGESASLHIRQCARIAGQVPIHKLARPFRLELLPAIARLLEQHLGCDWPVSVAGKASITASL
ncbi:MAG TPA: hypothetical protein VNO14_15985 [Blastocatellia bacterium]|nr:hypothetical protein [Blastocatellia bacterium]